MEQALPGPSGSPGPTPRGPQVAHLPKGWIPGRGWLPQRCGHFLFFQFLKTLRSKDYCSRADSGAKILLRRGEAGSAPPRAELKPLSSFCPSPRPSVGSRKAFFLPGEAGGGGCVLRNASPCRSEVSHRLCACRGRGESRRNSGCWREAGAAEEHDGAGPWTEACTFPLGPSLPTRLSLGLFHLV